MEKRLKPWRIDLLEERTAGELVNALQTVAQVLQ